MRTVISPFLKVCTELALAGSQLSFMLMMHAGSQDADSGHGVRAVV